MSDQEKRVPEKETGLRTRYNPAKVVTVDTAADALEALRGMDFTTVKPGFNYTAGKGLEIVLTNHRDSGISFSETLLEKVQAGIAADPKLSRAWTAARSIGGDVAEMSHERSSLAAVLANAMAQNKQAIPVSAAKPETSLNPRKPALGIAA